MWGPQGKQLVAALLQFTATEADTIGCAEQGTVYECNTGGAITALQAYYDPNVSLGSFPQSGPLDQVSLSARLPCILSS